MKLKKNFPALDSSLTYFNNAATTHKPKQMINARSVFWSKNVGLGDIKKKRLFQKIFSCKLRLAKILGCRDDEVFFFPQGTTGILNFLAKELKKMFISRNLSLQVAVSELEHHSNFLPWITNFEKVSIIPYDSITQRLDFSEIKWRQFFAISLPGSSNVLGSLWGGGFSKLKEIFFQAKAAGLLTIIDGAQIGINSGFNFQEMNADFFVFSAHKMFGPTNLGVLIVKKDVQTFFENKLDRFDKSVAWEVLEFFESIKFVLAKKITKISENEKDIILELLSFLRTFNEVKIVSHHNFKKHGWSRLISFSIEGIHAHDFVDLMAEQNVVLRGGDLCAKPLMKKLGNTPLIRISVAAYNDKRDLLKFKRAFVEVCNFLKNSCKKNNDAKKKIKIF